VAHPTVPGHRGHLVALRGDESELFRRHHRWLMRVTRRRLRCSEALAEDACAHAWLQLCRTQPERTVNLPGWLRVVALHEGFRLLRQAGREPLAEAVCKQQVEDGHGGVRRSRSRTSSRRPSTSSSRSRRARRSAL
jgi:DNA-directed RNA polymerase specialized sigma24 family protein